jgi:tetratricopeptide (TPR) repeat protein
LKNTLFKLALATCFLVAIVFSLKTLHEPDLWWQIRTGEWILEHGEVPATDVFSYTYEGTPWVNIKWGFEVVGALISKTWGPETVLLLQVLASCLLLFFVLRSTTALAAKYNLNHDIYKAVLPLLVLVMLTGIAYRINGRPEMLSHLFTAVFIFILLRNHAAPGRKILWLIPLQLIWANFHEAFATGWALVFIFAISSWIEYYFYTKKKIAGPVQKPILLSITALISVAVVAINPNGLALLESPFRIFEQVFENKYTTELLGIDSYLYWKREAYTAVFMLVITLVGLFTVIQKKKKEKWYWQLVQAHGISCFFLIAAFTYLASTAYRNIILLDIVLFPFFVNSLVLLLQKVEMKKWLTKSIQVLPFISLLCGIALYVAVVSGSYYRFTKAEEHYGLEVLSINNPDGAANYIRDHNLAGKIAFNDYLTSSYLMWKLQPSFKTMIDLRDLDVFPASFFRQFAEAINFPDSFKAFEKRYNTEYVVLFRSQYNTLHRYLYADSSYSMVYADVVAVVYQKTPTKLPPAPFSYSKPVPASSVAGMISKIFNPFYKPYDYSANNEDQYAAMYYMSSGDSETAKKYLQQSLKKGVDLHTSYSLFGQLFINRFFSDTSAGRAILLDSAQYYFKKSLKTEPKQSDAYFGVGQVCFEQQLYKEAVKNFEKAVEFNPQFMDGHLYLAQCYKMLANQNKSNEQQYLKLSIQSYKEADRMNPNNPVIFANLGFLYFRAGDCDNAVPYLEKVEGFPGLSEQERQSVKNCLGKCR